MSRRTRSVPVYRKHSPSCQAVIALNGRDFYLGPYGTKASRLQYDRLIGEWLQQGRQISPEQDATTHQLSVIELIVAYLHFAKDYYRKGNRPTSETKSILSVLRYVRLLYGRKSAGDFGLIALQAVMQRVIDAGLSRGTTNQNAGCIKCRFNWGVTQEPTNAAAAAIAPGEPGIR